MTYDNVRSPSTDSLRSSFKVLSGKRGVRTKKKKRLLLISSIVFLSLFAMDPSVCAADPSCSCSGGVYEGTYVKHEIYLCQTEMFEAKCLRFVTRPNEPETVLNGWIVTIEGKWTNHQYFEQVKCDIQSAHDLHVHASEGSLFLGHCVLVTVEFWLTAEDWIRIDDVEWTCETAVGGIVVPVNKFGLLAPYIGLTSAILVATVAIAICIKRVKHGKER